HLLPPLLSPHSLHDALPIFPGLLLCRRLDDLSLHCLSRIARTPATRSILLDSSSSQLDVTLPPQPHGLSRGVQSLSDLLVLCPLDRKSTRLNSSHQIISYAV